MSDKVDVVDTTQVTQPETNEGKFTQEDVNKIVTDRLTKEQKKWFKDLGIGEDFDKESFSKFKEYQEAQKSEAQRIKEEAEAYKKKYEEVSEKVKTNEIERGLEKALNELNIDGKHSKLVSKIVDLTDVYTDTLDYEKLKVNVEKVVKEYEIQSVSTQIQVGVDKSTDKPVSSLKKFYDEKYKNNPYYKG